MGIYVIIYSLSDSGVQHCCHIVFKWHPVIILELKLLFFIQFYVKMFSDLTVFAIKTLNIEGQVHWIVGYCISSIPVVCCGCVVYIWLNVVGVSI